MDAETRAGIEVVLPGGMALTLPAGTPPNQVRAYVDSLSSTGNAGHAPRPNSPYLTAEEASGYIRFPKKRIYNLTRTGAIPHRKQDGRLLFRRDELDAWLNQYYVGPDWAGPNCTTDL